MQTISQKEYRKMTATRKYGNRRIEVNGEWFDSVAEAARYRELLLLEAAGQVEDLTLQPEYELQPAFRDARGRKHRAIKYIADFRYIEVIDPQSIQGRTVVEDVKGMRTEVFKLKEKLFRFRYPSIDFRVVET